MVAAVTVFHLRTWVNGGDVHCYEQDRGRGRLPGG